MYKGFLRAFLFLFKPETAHHIAVIAVKALFFIPFIKSLIRRIYSFQDEKLQREVFGLQFKNPVGLAAGFDKNASFFKQFKEFGFSFIEVGTVTPKAQPGNPRPRSFRLLKDKALVNRMGFNNIGAVRVAERLKKRKKQIILGGNFGKNTVTGNAEAVEDYECCFRALYDHVDYLVINVSCPNINDLGDLQDKDQLSVIMQRLTAIRSGFTPSKPLLVKISPDLNFQQIDDVLDLIAEFGLDGIVATNTTTKRQNLASNPEMLAAIGEGGLSGRPIKDRSTEIIRYIHQKTGGNLPVIGVGGIMSAGDAIEKIEAGASLVQVYTGFIYEGPALVRKINRALAAIESKVTPDPA